MIGIVAAPVILLAAMGVWSRMAPPRGLGANDGRLAPCPATPNCVASRDAAPRQSMEPLRYAGSQEEARRALLSIVKRMERGRVVDERPGYIRAEFRSRFFGFVDDVEFLFDGGAGRIDFRSASRVGRSDFGANRVRLEEIRRRLTSSGAPAAGGAAQPLN